MPVTSEEPWLLLGVADRTRKDPGNPRSRFGMWQGLGDTAGSERQDLEIGLRSFQPDRNTHLGQASMGQ